MLLVTFAITVAAPAWTQLNISDQVNKCSHVKKSAYGKKSACDGTEIEKAMVRDGSGVRFIVTISMSELSERLTSVEGAQAFFNPSMVFVDGVTIAESSVPGRPEIDAVTASVYRRGNRLIPTEIVLPFGAGTIYKLQGKVSMFGHIFMSDTNAPLVFLVHDPRAHDPSCNCLQFVHIGGTGHVTAPNGSVQKLDE